MAGSVNKVILIGNLGRDPEIRSTHDGTRVANMSVATSESWKDKTSGERKERTEWHRVVVFNDKLVEIIEKYLKKGSKVYVEGALQTRKWTDKDNQERYSTEVVLQKFRGELTMLDGACWCRRRWRLRECRGRRRADGGGRRTRPGQWRGSGCRADRSRRRDSVLAANQR